MTRVAEGTDALQQGARLGMLDLPAGRAYAGPPVRGRRLWVVAVLACPECSGMHTHRGADTARLLSGRAVRKCPVTGRSYLLAPIQRRREARHPGGDR